MVALPWNGVRCHYLLGHRKRLIAWTECFSFTMGPWTEPENTHGIWTHNHPVLFIQLCHNILRLSFSVFFVLCNFSSQQRNSSCWLHRCDHELITPLLNICYLRRHLVKGKGRKRPSYSRRNTLTYCACRHSACVCHLQDFVLNDCEPFSFLSLLFWKQQVTSCLFSTAFFGALGSSYIYGYNLSVVNAPSSVSLSVQCLVYRMLDAGCQVLFEPVAVLASHRYLYWISLLLLSQYLNGGRALSLTNM